LAKSGGMSYARRTLPVPRVGPPGPWDANAAPTLTPIDVPTRIVNQRSAPSDAAFGDRNQAARNAAGRVDAQAERANLGAASASAGVAS
jgi:hypothetical protein